jgi:hypothetical protein
VAYTCKFIDDHEQDGDGDGEVSKSDEDDETSDDYFIYLNFMKVSDFTKDKDKVVKLSTAKLDTTEIFHQEEGGNVTGENGRFISPDDHPDIISLGSDMFTISVD